MPSTDGTRSRGTCADVSRIASRGSPLDPVIVFAVTWLPLAASAATEREAILALQPDAGTRWIAMLERSWRIADPDILEFCSSNMARFFECRAEAGRSERDGLGHVDASCRALSEAERAVSAYAEQFVVDQNCLPGELEDDVLRHLSYRELCNFVQALNAHDGYLRVMSLLDVGPGGPSPLRRPRDAAASVEPPSGDPQETDPLERLVALTDPVFHELRASFAAATARLSGISDLTTEVCRLRNATTRPAPSE